MCTGEISPLLAPVSGRDGAAANSRSAPQSQALYLLSLAPSSRYFSFSMDHTSGYISYRGGFHHRPLTRSQ